MDPDSFSGRERERERERKVFRQREGKRDLERQREFVVRKRENVCNDMY